MKRYMLPLFFICFLSTNAQDKPALTKEETVNYLNKKVKECEGHYTSTLMNSGETQIHYLKTLSFLLSGDKVHLGVISTNYPTETSSNECKFQEYNTYNAFNPVYIKSIRLDPGNKSTEPVGMIEITLISNTALFRSWTMEYQMENNSGDCYDWAESKKASISLSRQVVYLRFLQGDPENFNKIKKALEYLKSLFKAEDDPFGN